MFEEKGVKVSFCLVENFIGKNVIYKSWNSVNIRLLLGYDYKILYILLL